MERRNKQVCITIPSSAHEWIKRKCKDENISFSQWIYRKIVEESDSLHVKNSGEKC